MPLEHPRVVEGAVIGQADAHRLDHPVVFVVISPDRGPTPEWAMEPQDFVNCMQPTFTSIDGKSILPRNSLRPPAEQFNTTVFAKDGCYRE